MQSLLSSITHSLSQSRLTFALRVFVSYDALGRRKESVSVDIEPPPPLSLPLPFPLSLSPPRHSIRFLTPPRHTIRILTPPTPLHPAPSHSPPHLSPNLPTHLTPHPHSQLPTTAAPIASPSAPVSSVLSTPLPSTSPLAPPPSTHPTLIVSPVSSRCTSHAASLGSPSLTDIPSPPTPSLASSAAANALTLPSHGANAAVDVEMGDGSDGGSQVNSVSSASVPTSAPGSGSGPMPGSGEAVVDAVERKRAKLKQKKKARKERVRRRRVELKAGRPTDEEEEEVEDGDEAHRPSHADHIADMRVFEVPARLIGKGARQTEYARLMSQIQLVGDTVSADTFTQLADLLGADIDAVTARGKDWNELYEKHRVELVDLTVDMTDPDYRPHPLPHTP